MLKCVVHGSGGVPDGWMCPTIGKLLPFQDFKMRVTVTGDGGVNTNRTTKMGKWDCLT